MTRDLYLQMMEERILIYSGILAFLLLWHLLTRSWRCNCNMICPKCGIKLKVYYGEVRSDTEYKRFMKCEKCNSRYQSLEIMDVDGSYIIPRKKKKNGLNAQEVEK